MNVVKKPAALVSRVSFVKIKQRITAVLFLSYNKPTPIYEKGIF